jgi:hypothetical protein
MALRLNSIGDMHEQIEEELNEDCSCVQDLEQIPGCLNLEVDHFKSVCHLN